MEKLKLQLMKKFSFKFISEKGNLECIITIKGEMYTRGEIIYEDTLKKLIF